ncbi:hypothetical protein B0H16DRAFT_1419803, partial [Mycena metata]
MKFSDYATPHSSLKYSSEYFSALTFEHAHSIDYPVIGKPGFITAWCFDSNEPASASSTLVQPGEVVPHMDDLLPISRAMELAYAKGSQSVVVTFDGIAVIYHFSKIRLLLVINNNRPAIIGARSLYSHIIASNILLPSDLDHFKTLRIRAPVTGFQVTQFPLWKLACLLGETWLEEDVVNALLELLYLENATATNNDPTFIALPTSFAQDMRYLFEAGSDAYSSNLSLLHRRLRAVPMANISFVTCENDHFSGYRYFPKFSSLRLGDSMGRPSSGDILPAFNWFIDGISGGGYPAPEGVGEGHMPLQGLQSGSCGIASVNFVTRGELSDPPIWDDVSSPLFRNKALQDIIVYHLTVQQTVSFNLNWLVQCALAPLEKSEVLIDDPYQPVGYNDYNLYRPTGTHLIHAFSAKIRTQPLIALPRGTPKRDDSQLSASSIPVPPISKLPAFSTSAPVIILPADADDNDDIIDLSGSSPIISPQPTKVEPEIINL